MKVCKLTLALIAALSICAVAFAQDTATNGRFKDEAGLKRMRAVSPEPGADIEETKPMIVADFSKLEAPIYIASVVITLDGADITTQAEINPMYAMYEPPADLDSGIHEVRITAKNINHDDIEPLSWNFWIGGAGTEFAVLEEEEEAPETGETAERDNTTGRLTVSTDYVSAKFIPQTIVDVSQLFGEKEGMKLNTDLSFTNASPGRTIIAAYHRETQPYTDIELDKGRMQYYDSNFNATLGHFWTQWSNLTLIGAELAGAQIEKEIGPWKLNFLSGRTQDPSTSGTFKQMTSGLRADYTRGRNTSSIIGLRAYELYDAVIAQTAVPARDSIAAYLHEFRYSDDIKANLEVAANNRRERGALSTSDQAMRFAVVGVANEISGEMEIYSIAENYLPISEGSLKFLKSDREGYRAKGKCAVTQRLSAGGEYERYDVKSTDVTTKRGNAFTTLSSRQNNLTYRKAKLTTSLGTISENDGVTLLLTLPATGMFAETRLTAGWQDIDYSSISVLTNTSVLLFNLSSSYKDILAFSYSHTVAETEDLRNLTETKNLNNSIGLNWSIIPFKLLWTGRYETLNNRGTNSDNGETRLKTALKYILDEVYSFNLGWDRISYSDAVTQAYEYEQNIFRTGMEWKF